MVGNTKLIIDLDENFVKFIKQEYSKDININEYVEKIVYELLKEENINVENVFVSIQSASKDEIKELNCQYRNVDNATDVLSFPIFSFEELKEIINEKDNSKKIKEINLGDIIICLDVVKVQALNYNTGNFRELLYMITHGMCHLLGYDHIDPEDKKIMREKEEKILSKLGVGKINAK